MTSGEIYLVATIGNVCDVLKVVGILLLIWVLCAVVVRCFSNEATGDEYKLFQWKCILLAAVIAVALAGFCPTKNDLLIAYALPRISSNVQAFKALPSDFAAEIINGMKEKAK